MKDGYGEVEDGELQAGFPVEELLGVAQPPKEHERDGRGEEDSYHAKISKHVEENELAHPEEAEDHSDNVLADPVRVERRVAEPEVDGEGHVHHGQCCDRVVEAGVGFTNVDLIVFHNHRQLVGGDDL